MLNFSDNNSHFSIHFCINKFKNYNFHKPCIISYYSVINLSQATSKEQIEMFVNRNNNFPHHNDHYQSQIHHNHHYRQSEIPPIFVATQSRSYPQRNANYYLHGNQSVLDDSRMSSEAKRICCTIFAVTITIIIVIVVILIIILVSRLPIYY